MKAATYLHDGYTRPGYIAPEPDLHGELRFVFRPGVVEERGQLVDAAQRMASDAYDRHLAVYLAEKLVRWELVDEQGQEVPVTADHILRLHPELFIALEQIVLGWIASDVDPLWADDDKQRVSDERQAAAASGKIPGDIDQEGFEKN